MVQVWATPLTPHPPLSLKALFTFPAPAKPGCTQEVPYQETWIVIHSPFCFQLVQIYEPSDVKVKKPAKQKYTFCFPQNSCHFRNYAILLLHIKETSLYDSQISSINVMYIEYMLVYSIMFDTHAFWVDYYVPSAFWGTYGITNSPLLCWFLGIDSWSDAFLW